MSKKLTELLSTDVLIMGAGAAGMRAAIAAAENERDVTIITKGQAGKSGATPMACPSYQAAFGTEDKRDSPEVAFEDTCFEGRYLGDENLIKTLVEEAPERAMDLVRYGVRFRKNEDGSFIQVIHPGQSFDRNLVIKGGGYAMASGLRRKVTEIESINLLEDTIATRILSKNGRVGGAVALNMRTGQTVFIQTPAVVLATGGYPELWRWTDTEPGMTGDGAWLGFQAGADLVDLEMMLFYPAGLCYPTEAEGTLVQYEGLLTDKYCGGVMLNGKGEPFLPKTDSLPVRDVMMKLMFREIESGRHTPHGGLYIDLSKSPREPDEIQNILDQLDSLPYNNLADLGVDIQKEPIEVKPVTHYTLGGVRINPKGETTIEGLYAAGEVTGNVHGANRVSGNALAETMVFGRRAGLSASDYAVERNAPSINQNLIDEEVKRIESFLKPCQDAIRPIELKRAVKSVMHEHVNYRRNAEKLRKAIAEFRRMRMEDVPRTRAVSGIRVYNYEWQEAIEATQMVDLGELIAASALAREESRGHHWRTDFPKMKPEWEKHTVVRIERPSSYSVSKAPVIRNKDRSEHRRTADEALIKAGVIEGYEGD